jgi:tRNA1(Val) A37 N6-methylase TrmN6
MEVLGKYSTKQLKDILKDFIKENNIPLKLTGLNKIQIIKNLLDNKYDIDKLPEKVKNVSKPKNILKKYNLKAYTDEEQDKFMNESYKEANPLKAKKEYYNVKTKKNEFLELQEHQKSFVKHFFVSKTKGSIVFHGVGTGKTITAVVASHYYLQLNPKGKVIVISPPALMLNFIDGMRQFGLDLQDTRFSYYSFEAFSRLKDPIKNEKTLILVDEAHILRTYITKDIYEDGEEKPNKNKRGYYILDAIKKCDKAIMLTATPFINKLYDIENLISMCDKKDPVSQDLYAEIMNNTETRNDYFRYRISYYQKDVNSEFFPKKKVEYIPLVMNKEQTDIYNKISNGDLDALEMVEDFDLVAEDPKGLTAFYNGARQVSDKLGDLKLDFISKRIKEPLTTGKFIIYSTFIGSGLNNIKKMLEKSGKTYKTISGKENTEQKEKAKDAYNKGEIQVLLISKAGTEGIDTVGTEAIFIMEGSSWNEGLVEQAIARAVRFKSHYALPKEQQIVYVYRLLVCKDKDVNLINDINKGNISNFQSLKERIQAKNKEVAFLLKDLNKKTEITKENDGKKRTDFKKEEYKKLSAEEKKAYIEGLQFNRYEVENKMRELTASSPSIEVKLTIMSLAKQEIIDEFIKEIDNKNIKQLEDFDISDFEKRDFSNPKDIKDYIDNQIETVYNKIENKDSRLNMLKEKAEKQYNTMKQKLDLVKRRQAFYTPEDLVEKMLKQSTKLKNFKEGLDILEATAGIGNLILPILQQKKNHRIYMCEIEETSREFLKELVKDSENLLTLYEQGDFLKFINNIEYDLVLMNPPFHLQKKYIKGLDKDYYDIDFVKRAYYMLKDGGELIALVRYENSQKKQYLDWLEEKKAIIMPFEYKNWEEGKTKGKLSKISKIKLSFIKMIKSKTDDKERNNELDLHLDKFQEKQAEKLENFEKGFF